MYYCERCGGRMNSGDWYGHCEFCGEDDEWTMNQPLDKEKVKCQNCGTEIYKVRRYCHYCGAKNYAAFKKGSEYCVRCGNALENGVCPNCGKTKSQIRERAYKPEENGFCPVCGESVLFEDYFCSKCGAELFKNHPEKKPEPKKVKCNFKHCEICGGDLYFDEEIFGYKCKHCGTDTDEIYLEPKINKTRIKCKRCGNEMYETRRFCRACGGKNELAFKKGENYCYSCGIALENDVCPECGRIYTTAYMRSNSRKELLRCSVCSENVRPDDNFCQNCGTALYEEPPIKDLVEQNTGSSAKIPEYTEKEKPVKYYSEPNINTTLWLVLGIVSLVFCCLPTGIGTIICSIGAKRALDEGDDYSAKRKIGFAKTWFFIGCAFIFVIMTFSAIVNFLIK